VTDKRAANPPTDKTQAHRDPFRHVPTHPRGHSDSSSITTLGHSSSRARTRRSTTGPRLGRGPRCIFSIDAAMAVVARSSAPRSRASRPRPRPLGLGPVAEGLVSGWAMQNNGRPRMGLPQLPAERHRLGWPVRVQEGLSPWRLGAAAMAVARTEPGEADVRGRRLRGRAEENRDRGDSPAR